MRGEKKLSTQLTTKSRAACGDCCLLEAAFPQSDQTSREIFFWPRSYTTRKHPNRRKANRRKADPITIQYGTIQFQKMTSHMEAAFVYMSPPPRVLPGQQPLPGSPTVTGPVVATDGEEAKNQGVRLKVGFMINPRSPEFQLNQVPDISPTNFAPQTFFYHSSTGSAQIVWFYDPSNGGQYSIIISGLPSAAQGRAPASMLTSSTMHEPYGAQGFTWGWAPRRL